MHVTYVFKCPCKFQYVGRTTRKLTIRVQEHMNNIAKGYVNDSVSRHFQLFQGRDPSLLTFYGIDRVKPH